MATKKQAKKVRQRARIRKAKPWVATYQGKNIIESYCRAFKVDPICAEKDLAAMGAATAEQRELLRREEEIRLQKKREERTARFIKKLEKNNVDLDKIKLDAASVKAAYKIVKANNIRNKRPNPKRKCANCGRAMKQQFNGLKHCKCGMSWDKRTGYFERTPDMVFALERRVIKKGKNSIRTKQVPVIRYKVSSEANMGTICKICKGDMAKANGCKPSTFICDGKKYVRIQVGEQVISMRTVMQKPDVRIAERNTATFTMMDVIVSVALYAEDNCFPADVMYVFHINRQKATSFLRLLFCFFQSLDLSFNHFIKNPKEGKEN